MSTSSVESIDITSTPTPTTKHNSTFSDELVKEEHLCQKPGCEEVCYIHIYMHTYMSAGLHNLLIINQLNPSFSGYNGICIIRNYLDPT